MSYAITTYTAEIAQWIIDELRCGRSLRAVCRDPGMPPYSTVRQWISDDREGFATRYRQARTITTAGRPTIYHAVIAEWIVQQLMDGRPLAHVCRDPGMPSHVTVRQWEKDDREGFAQRFRTAREVGCDIKADRIIDMADNPGLHWIERRLPDGTTEMVPDPATLRRLRLRINAEQWQLSKMLPRRYG